jgi:two-component system, chemotaxis family, chemotaxis protein CheY
MAKIVLIVDDSPTARMFVHRCLVISKKFPDAGYVEASDGNEALAILQEKSGDVQVVFTDLNMPNMDGEMLYKRMQASPRLHEIPVIVISSAGNPAKEQALLDMGVKAVIKKPISPAHLAIALGKLGV